MHDRRRAIARRPWACAVALLASIVVLVEVPAAAGARAEWDARVVPIVREVEELRGLTFEHPVEVEFLSEDAFTSRVTIDRGELSASDEREIERSEAAFRAVGLVAGDVDLVASLSQLQESGVLAYYEPGKERVTVRGTELDAPTRVTLAHELTHALQDQHFGLERLRRRARAARGSAAVRALIEGDAKRVEQAYLAGLSRSERAEYAAWQRRVGTRVSESLDAEGVPAALVAIFQSPYALGPEMLRVLVAGRDEAAIDALFSDPPVSDLSYLDPRSLLDHGATREVPHPTPGDGEVAVGKRRDVFGAFALYLVLATSGDPVAALEVADGWGGDELVTFTRGATTCVRANFVGVDARASTAIGDALTAWSAARPPGDSDVARAGDVTTLTACDPGDTTADPGTTPEAALVTVLLRNTLLAQGAEQVGIESASCVVDRTLGDASFRPVLDATVADPSAPLPDSVSGPFSRTVTAAFLQCRDA